MKKIPDTVLLYLMVALMIIGGHQTYSIAQQEGLQMGFIKSYWIYMIVIAVMAIYQIRKGKAAKEKEVAGAKDQKVNAPGSNRNFKGKKKRK